MTRIVARLRSDEDGMTLVEVLVAVFILAVAVMALAATATSSLQVIRVSRDRQNATQLASSTLEQIRALDWNEIAFSTSDTSWTSAPGVSGSQYNGEDVVTHAEGAVTHLQVGGGFEARTYVTYAAGTSNTQKRITTIVSWDDRGTTRSVQENTLVADARRGLDAPRFIIDPASASKATVSGQTTCFTNTLTNLGERDRYDWKMTSGGSLLTRTVVEDGVNVSRQGFKQSGWFAWSRVDGQAMTDANGDGRPDTAQFLDRNHQAEVKVCYEPIPTESPANAPTFTHEFRSTFDSSVTDTFEHKLSVVSANTFLYFDRTGSGRTLVMDKTASIITTDTDFDGDGRFGYRVQKGQSADRLRWDYQFPVKTNVSANAFARLYLASGEALDGDPNGIGDVLAFRVTVQKLNTAKSQVTTILPPTDFTTVMSASGWHEVVIGLSTPATTFNKNEYLRFTFECLNPGGTEDCHIDLDADLDTTSDKVLSGVAITAVEQ